MGRESGTEPNGDLTARVYRDAWAFLREAEACAEEDKDERAQTYARAAVLHAVSAAEGFLDGLVEHVDVDPEVDSKVEAALRKYRTEVSRNRRLGEEWSRLSDALGALDGLGRLPGWESKRESALSLKDEIRKRMLDVAIEHCRENLRDTRAAKDVARLSELRSEMGKRSLKTASLARRWFEGATGLTGRSSESGEDAIRDFQRIVLKARGESAAGGPQDITLEEARLACGAVRSMIAGLCGAAGRELPHWVREIQDRL